jgi:hypothetical protein
MNISNDYIEPQILEYLEFVDAATDAAPNIVKKAHIKENLEKFGNAINTFLVYPDILADIMTPRDSSFSMFFTQRLVLRSMSRSRQSYHTFTRGFSKSFLAFYSRYVHTMLVPRHKSFVTAGTKGQAAQIAKEKIVDDIWNRFPLLQNEMQKMRVAGQLRNAFIQGPDYAEFRFSHGGIFDVVGGTIRGFRRHSGIFEEVIQLDSVFTNEVAIPLLNKPRENSKGKVNPLEPHGTKIFITTAGYQGTYAYDKLIETLCYAALDPSRYSVLGGTYQIPINHGLLQQDTVRELLSSTTYDRDSFEREFMGIWSGAPAGSVFSANTISELRKVVKAEYNAVEPKDPQNPHFYVVSADMAKDGSAKTALVVMKVQPKEYQFNYTLVNLFTIDSSDYEKVANVIKQTVNNYSAKLLVYDANGIGAAVRDWLNKDTRNEEGIVLQGLGIINPPKSSEKDIKYYNPSQTICYEVKATGEKADQIHQLFFSRISNGAIRFLIKSSEAVQKFAQLEGFKRASNVLKERKMRPYLFMDRMELELKNLEIVDTSDNINRSMRIKRRDPKVQKDFFSAAEYAVYASNLHLELDYYTRNRKNTGVKASDFVFID